MKSLSEYNVPYSYIPIIAGPTASGKSALAIELAQKINGEIISCDSMQIYKYLDIGTAKVTQEEQALVPHHMIDIIDPEIPFSVNDFVVMALEKIEDILSSGKMPVLCGGTGQYISSLYYGIKYVDEPVDQKIIDDLYKEVEESGIQRIYDELSKIDPIAIQKIHINNTRRVIRAYAVYLSTGKTFTWWNENSKTEGPKFPFKLYEINHDRSVLYEKINKRVEIMVKNGLIDEVKHIKYTRVLDNSTARQAIGYKELFDYFDGNCTLDEAIYEIKLRSRHYAKKQLTWFRYMDGLNLIEPENLDTAVESIIKEIK